VLGQREAAGLPWIAAGQAQTARCGGRPMTNGWFEGIPVLGRMKPSDVAQILEQLGDVEGAEALRRDPAAGAWQAQQDTVLHLGPDHELTSAPRKIAPWPFGTRPWQYTAHTFGFIPLPAGRQKDLQIYSVDYAINSPTLHGSKINIALDHLRVASYPGRGTHQILVHLAAENSAGNRVKPLDVHFNTLCRAREGQRAGTRGHPVFVGLRVPEESLTLKCRTINVKNEQDEQLLAFLESDQFNAGLSLLGATHPAIGLFSQMALEVAKSIAQNSRNVSVQDITLGFGVGLNPGGVHLAEGEYLAVQTPERERLLWSWRDWVYDRSTGTVVAKADKRELIPYNYIMLGVARSRRQ
jgi:hypothetical protein